MKILSLDISSQTGFAFFEGSKHIESGTLKMDESEISSVKALPYPLSYIKRSERIASLLVEKVIAYSPEVVVIEETNKGKARYTQKLLEFIHLQFLQRLTNEFQGVKIVYLNTSQWRKTLNIKATKEDKKNNSLVNQAKKNKKSKKDLGVKGKITTKHLAIRFVNDALGLDLKMKDNNTADAIALNLAYQMGASAVSGV